MSKFTTRLDRVYRTAAPAMGFRRASEDTELPPMLLVLNITKSISKKAKSNNGEKIDAAIVYGTGEVASDLKNLSKIAGDAPLGLLINEDSKPDELKDLIDLDWDFLIFGLQTPIELICKEEKGKILMVEPSLAPTTVRAINDLNFQIDGVLLNNDSSPITIKFLLACQLFSGLLNKPLLVNTGFSSVHSELCSLQEAGVKGIVLPEGAPQKLITEVKKEISQLPRTIKRKAAKGALLPHISFQTEEVKEKVEEGEEDEDGEDI
jgi:hypothetical protein